MAKTPSNHGKSWSKGEVKQLKELAKGNTPTRVMGLKLGRTPGAVQNKAGGGRRFPEVKQSESLQQAEIKPFRTSFLSLTIILAR